jgi:hypothetical protein
MADGASQFVQTPPELPTQRSQTLDDGRVNQGPVT